MTPDKVVSNPKSLRLLARSRIYSSNNLPACIAAASGENGERPPAMRSALTNCLHRAYFGRNLRAKVVFPEPLGPATMYIDGRLPSFLRDVRHP